MSNDAPKTPLTKVDEALFELVLPQIAEGKTLRQVAREMNFSPSSFRYWVATEPERTTRYTNARYMQAEAMFDELIDIADDQSKDSYTDDEGNERENTDHLNRVKVRIDARKWIIARNHPKRFGDKVEQTLIGSDNGPIKFSIAIDRVNSVDNDTEKA